MHDHQVIVKRFVTQNQLDYSVEARMLDLISEFGELSKEVLKNTNYVIDPFEANAKCVEGFGDVYFSLLALAEAANIDLDKALHKAVEQYAVRISAAGGLGDGK
jgi:NTP pyrophosphatase (non-canonical NTP hydrolase)